MKKINVIVFLALQSICEALQLYHHDNLNQNEHVFKNDYEFFIANYLRK